MAGEAIDSRNVYVSYKENAGLGETSIGRWLGVSHRVSSLMSYWILTVQRITNLAMQTTEFKDATAEFDESIKACVKEDSHWSDYMDYDADFQAEFDAAVNDPDVPEAEKNFTPNVYDDHCLNMELAVPRDSDGPDYAKVTKRMQVKDGLPI
jgi:hypothetical protein